MNSFLSNIVKISFGIVALVCLCLATVPAHAYTISTINISGVPANVEAQVREIIPIKEGQEFSEENLELSKEYLKKWGIFESVSASSLAAGGSVDVGLELKQALTVDSIVIAGNYPFIESKVRKYLTLNTGDAYTPERAAEQAERIKSFYARQGFFDTEVYIEEKARPDIEGVNVTFHIRKGQLLRYRHVTITGNRAYPDGRFYSAINPWRPYSELKLGEALRKLRDFYHSHGYPKARIRISEKKFDFKNGYADVAIGVSEGPKVEVKFEGSPHTSRKTLRRAVTIFKSGNFDDFELEDSAKNIADVLKRAGYPNAKVAWKREQKAENTIAVKFMLSQGGPEKIKFIVFEGRKGVEESQLLAMMKNKPISFMEPGAFRSDSVKEDTDAIRKVLSNNGYRNASIGEWKLDATEQGRALIITIPIDEGTKTFVSSVLFEGVPKEMAPALVGKLANRPNRPFAEELLKDDAAAVFNHLADNGYPFAKADGSFTINGNNSADVLFRVNTGRFVRIGQVIIVGDVLTSQKAIRKVMRLKWGDPFSYERVIESQLNIRRLGAFSAVNIETIGLSEYADVVHLKVKVEELRPFRVDLGFNYTSQDGLTGSMLFSNLNSFGWAKTNTLKLVGGRRLSRAEIGWIDPMFLGSDFEMSDFAWLQYNKRPSYAYTQAGGSVGWFRRFRRLGLSARYEIAQNYFVKGDSVAADADSLRNNTISKISLFASFDSRNSFSYPTSGFYTLCGADIFDEFRGSGANFVKFKWLGENDMGFLRIFTLATQLRFNRIQAIGSGVSVPTNELLFMGGDDTIRGYPEDELGPANAAGQATGSRTRWIWNEELRLRFFKVFSIAGFLDMGALENTFHGLTWANTRKSAGVGLRYITPVGPIRLDYGWKLARRAGEPLGRLHLTFGFVF